MRSFLKYRRWADIPSFHRMVVSTAATNALLTVLSAACTILISRTLGVEAKGVVSWMVSYSGISVIIISLGFGSSLVKHMAKNQDNGPVFILLNMIILAVTTAIALPIICWAVSPLAIVRSHPVVFLLATLAIPFSAFSAILWNVLISKGKSTLLNLLAVFERAIVIGLYILLLVSGNVRPLTVIMATAAAMLIRLVFSWRYVRPYIDRLPARAELWKALVMTRELMFAAYFNNLANGYTGALLTIVLGIAASSKELGYYAIAATFIGFGQILPGAIGTFALPNLSQEKNLKNKRRKKRLILLMTFAIMLVTAAPLYLLPETLIRILFGISFLPAAPCLQIMATGMIAAAMIGVCQPMIASHHREWRLVISSGSLALIISVLTWMNYDNFSALTAACIYSVSYATGAFITLTIVLYNYFEDVPHA